jgi:phage-related minor tail protein
LPIVAVLVFTLPDFHWKVVLAAIVVGGVVGFLVQSYVEIIRIIADTLLPR